MGIGWDYFNNVCQAMRVALGFVASIVGLIVVFIAGGAIMQLIDANRAPDATLIVPPVTTPASPSVKANSQFKSPQTPGTPAPANTGLPAASTTPPKSNPQFQTPGTPAPTTPGTRMPGTDSKPNPQFAPNPSH